MKLTSNTAVVLVCSSLVVHALPGVQQPRSAPSSTMSPFQTQFDINTRESIVQATSISNASTAISTATASTSLTVIESPSNTAVPSEPVEIILELDTRQDDESLLSSVLDPLDAVLGDGQADNEDEDTDDDYGDECDDEDELVDYDDDTEWRRRGAEEQYNCFDALKEVSLQLAEIKSMLVFPIQSKRELIDLVTNEDHESLTSEQKAALYTLVKGVDGYQTSVEGATDVDQTEQESQEMQQAAMQASNSNANTTSTPAWSPTQVDSLLVLLSALLQDNKQETPPGSTIGSQAGQAVSQAGYTASPDGTMSGEQGTESSSTSKANNIVTQLQVLRSREQDLMSQLQASSGRQPTTSGPKA